MNFNDLLQPGSTETVQRIYLQTCAPINKKTDEEGNEIEEVETEFEKIYEEAKSYIHLKVSLSESIIPKTQEKLEPTPAEIVPIKQFVTWPYSKDPCDDFGK